METRVCRLYGQGDVRIETDSVSPPGPGEVLVRVMRGGICGSDLHYFLHGGFGPIRVREPIIMGHEFAGYIEQVGPDVSDLAVGDRVGINPSQPCGSCKYCEQDTPQHCLNMRFIGSAFALPHEQGGFRERLTIKAEQCVQGGQDTDFAKLASAEPLAVCLHAARKAGDLRGQKILVNGAGPIGALCVAVARHFHAQEIVVADLFTKTLDVAMQMGADKAINLSQGPEQLNNYAADKGYFDLVFECSAAQAAMANIFKVIRPQGMIIQVGVTGELNIPLSSLVGKEIKWMGSHRFHYEYKEAIKLISRGNIDVTPMISEVFPMDAVQQALDTATDRSKAVKVQLAFE
ncbi:L-idonate 5-dehydrogenase [Desulfogranum japonicum]|uniref:L-idonate 5-dehydrogenase n=1 Tax=Desulfogranum japonicum TaxID=231447 RepID=UPI0004250DB3|nr:L-idonate 5-dehydrogenase [Desulfogranum japonicum]